MNYIIRRWYDIGLVLAVPAILWAIWTWRRRPRIRIREPACDEGQLKTEMRAVRIGTSTWRTDMARRPQWRKEIDESVRREAWTVRGPSRLVKVTEMSSVSRTRTAGFVTQEKVLVGKTPWEIRDILGLHRDQYQNGCEVHALLRLPQASEFTYELTAHYPDGWAYVPWLHDPNYPPGSANAHQWQLIAAIPCEHILDLGPYERYPCLHRP